MGRRNLGDKESPWYPDPVNRSDLGRPYPSLHYNKDPWTVPQEVEDHRFIDPEKFWDKRVANKLIHKVPEKHSPVWKTPTNWQFARFPEPRGKLIPRKHRHNIVGPAGRELSTVRSYQVKLERKEEKKRLKRLQKGRPEPKEYLREYWEFEILNVKTVSLPRLHEFEEVTESEDELFDEASLPLEVVTIRY